MIAFGKPPQILTKKALPRRFIYECFYQSCFEGCRLKEDGNSILIEVSSELNLVKIWEIEEILRGLLQGYVEKIRISHEGKKMQISVGEVIMNNSTIQAAQEINVQSLIACEWLYSSEDPRSLVGIESGFNSQWNMGLERLTGKSLEEVGSVYLPPKWEPRTRSEVLHTKKNPLITLQQICDRLLEISETDNRLLMTKPALPQCQYYGEHNGEYGIWTSDIYLFHFHGKPHRGMHSLNWEPLSV